MKFTPPLFTWCLAVACLVPLHRATAQLVVTNVTLVSGTIWLSGTGGTITASCVLLSHTDVSGTLAGWTPIATNSFDVAGNFAISNATPPGAASQFYIVTLGQALGPVLVPGAFFASPTGSDTNLGTVDGPFKTISRGLTAVGNGGVLYLRAGTYPQSTKLTLSRAANPTNTIRIWAYPGETPLIDNTGDTSDGISISGSGYHLRGLNQQFAGHNGIVISGNSNLIENCFVYGNTNTGLHITGGSSGATFPAYNLILNCDSSRNYDPPVGGNADGFTAKWNVGPGNVFSGCRAWENSDDGWDLWMATSPVLITNCWSWHHGYNWWNSPSYNGNGNGFKLGGNYVGTPHRIVRCAAFSNAANGIDQNNNTAGQTVDNNTCWANGGKNINLNHDTTNAPMTGFHVVRNNLSIAGGSGDSFMTGSILTSNSWQIISPPASAADLQSTDISYATAPRQPDGSLPSTPFLHPVTGGRLIDRGVIISGDTYSGAAPDLGAFEVQ
jgi:hypothetical protein